MPLSLGSARVSHKRTQLCWNPELILGHSYHRLCSLEIWGMTDGLVPGSSPSGPGRLPGCLRLR